MANLFRTSIFYTSAAGYAGTLNSIPPELWDAWQNDDDMDPAPHALPMQSVKSCTFDKDFSDEMAGFHFTKGTRGRVIEQYDVLGGRSWAKVALDGSEGREVWVLRDDVDVDLVPTNSLWNKIEVGKE